MAEDILGSEWTCVGVTVGTTVEEALVPAGIVGEAVSLLLGVVLAGAGLLESDSGLLTGVVTLDGAAAAANDEGTVGGAFDGEPDTAFAAVETVGVSFSGVRGTIPLQNNFLPKCL